MSPAVRSVHRQASIRGSSLLACVGVLLANAAFAQCVQGNCVDGEGEWRYDDGSRYVGQWKDSKRQGRGTLERKDGGVLTRMLPRFGRGGGT